MRIVSAAVRADSPLFAKEDGAPPQLVTRARSGDAGAFRAIFEQHAPAVRRFLADLLRDRDAADEATQETFVRAHARLPSLRDQDKLRPWLFGIARRVFQEALRARRPRLAPADTDPPPPTPEGLLIGREADHLLAGALAELPEQRRAALLLRIDHGLEYDEIREVMGWSLAKVKNEIHRARLTLRARLSQYVGGNP